jgi:hypothetical protein
MDRAEAARLCRKFLAGAWKGNSKPGSFGAFFFFFEVSSRALAAWELYLLKPFHNW